MQKNTRMGLAKQNWRMQMSKQFSWILILILLPSMNGCASKKYTYPIAGAMIGAGGGYAIDHDGKDAAIGGLSGGITGGLVATFQGKREEKKYRDGYDQGYTQAQLEIAVTDWKTNTGKKIDEMYNPTYHRIKIPKKEINNVIYETHYETLEVYQ